MNIDEELLLRKFTDDGAGWGLFFSAPLHTGYNLHLTVLNDKSNNAFVLLWNLRGRKIIHILDLKCVFF